MLTAVQASSGLLVLLGDADDAVEFGLEPAPPQLFVVVEEEALVAAVHVDELLELLPHAAAPKASTTDTAKTLIPCTAAVTLAHQVRRPRYICRPCPRSLQTIYAFARTPHNRVVRRTRISWLGWVQPL